jgi:hypothetical protein
MMNSFCKTPGIPYFPGVFLFIILLASAGIMPGCKTYTAFNAVFNPEWEEFKKASAGTPRLEYLHSFPAIHLYGTPAEMGRQYGSILQKQLKGLDYISSRFFPENKLDEFLQIAIEAEKHLPDETIEFISAMSGTSGVDYYRLLAVNTVPKVSCSVLAVWGEATEDGNLIMGRNADYAFKKINKALGIIVVKHPDEGNATVASSFLGLAGTFTGINEKGVCYGNMLVYNGHEEKDFSDGLPIQLLMQEAAEKQNTARGMIDYLTKKQHVIPINVMCADSTEAIVAELGQKNFAIREGSRGVLAASNLFHSSGMFDEPETDKRFSVLMTKARDYFGIFNPGHMKEAMHAARKPNETLQTVLFEPAKMLMHVSMNKVPASKGPFITFDVMELLEK